MTDTEISYNPFDWFWTVAGDERRAWSSAAFAYVKKWPAERTTYRVVSEEALARSLAEYGLSGPVARPEDVVVERERRLALGFDYNFGDERGTHRIGTTEADMRGWDEVGKAAQAALNLGAPATEVTIVTDTGPVVVTALEWQSVLVAAAAYRQPIWAASFALQALPRIPADFKNDEYWR